MFDSIVGMGIAALDDTTAVDAALCALLDADPAVAERADLERLVTNVRTVRGFLDAFDVAIARRARQLDQRDYSRPPDTPRPDTGRDSVVGSLLGAGCRSGREAQATDTREGVCAELPGFEQALAAGDVSGAHLDALGRLLKPLTDEERLDVKDRVEELLEHAAGEYAETFEKTARNIINQIRTHHRPDSDADELARQRKLAKISTWVDKPTGMHKTLIELDPLRHDEWWRALQAHLDGLRQEPGNSAKTYPELQIDAFLAAVQPPLPIDHTPDTSTGTGTGTRPAPVVRVPKFLVVIDLKTMIDGPHDDTIAELANGTPLPVSVLRSLACDADIVPVLLSGEGQPLWVGRTRRLATPAQRDALGAMYGHCLGIGCTVPFDDCPIHHSNPWKPQGLTDIDNLAPICEHHHHQIHDHGWHLAIHDNHAAITWARPDGTVAYHGPPPTRTRRAA